MVQGRRKKNNESKAAETYCKLCKQTIYIRVFNKVSWYRDKRYVGTVFPPIMGLQVELRRGRLAVRGRLHRQMVSCPAGCGETFLKRNAKAHAAYRCPMRTVTCPMAACTKQMQAKDVPRYVVLGMVWPTHDNLGVEGERTGR